MLTKWLVLRIYGCIGIYLYMSTHVYFHFYIQICRDICRTPSVCKENKVKLRWFAADKAYNSLHAYAAGLSEFPLYHAVDIFGGSQRVAQAWRREGMSGISFDVKLSRSHDLTSEDGCRSLLRYLMRPPVSQCTHAYKHLHHIGTQKYICVHIFGCGCMSPLDPF